MAEIPALDDIRSRVAAVVADQEANIDVSTDGYYVTVTVVSQIFAGMRPVARQQLIYRALAELITSGALHAVNIKALAPQEA